MDNTSSKFQEMNNSYHNSGSKPRQIIRAIENFTKKYQEDPFFIDAFKKTKDILIKENKGDPYVKNILTYAFLWTKGKSPRSNLEKASCMIKSHIEKTERKISDLASRKIKDKSVVFTYSYSKRVLDSIFLAKEHGKNFILKIAETRPSLKGRITAKEASRKGIKVHYHTDSAVEHALKKSDIMIIGGEAITKKGEVICDVGANLFSESAENLDVPVYVCADSWIFDAFSVFEQEAKNTDIWINKPRDIKTYSLLYEKINSKNITGIISELGIYSPSVFIHEVKNAYPWMFGKH